MAETSDAEILEFALELSAEAGRFILPFWKNTRVDHKPDGSEVTAADTGAEQILRRRIAQRFPHHAMIGEEFGGANESGSRHVWFLDPIDGTASFAIALPLFGTLIGYVRDGAPRVGVIALHALGETIYAADGQGCWRRSGEQPPQRLRTSSVTHPADAFIVATAMERTDLDPRDPLPSVHLSRLYQSARRFRWSGDCVNYALLCSGFIDVALDSRMNPWDIAALVPCVREAGGVLSSIDGHDDVIWRPNLVASATPALHAQVLRLLN